MRVVVYGGRNFSNKAQLESVLDNLHKTKNFSCVIVGCAEGADTLAENWAYSRKIKVERYPAAWSKFGKAAGSIRNQQMIDEGKPQFAVSFPGGKGTADMALRLQQKRIKTVKV